MESLIKCIKRIEDKRPKTIEILQQDIDIQDIIAINIERAVQISIDIANHILVDYDVAIPKTMSSVFNALATVKVIDINLANNLAKSVGFKNIAVYEYNTINWKIVFEIITNEINDFKLFITAIMKLL